MPFENAKISDRTGRTQILAVIFLCLVPIVIFFPTLFLHKILYGYDIAVLAIPFHNEALRSVAAHQWPLWMPDVLGGMPGIAACNLAFTYPTDFLGCLAGLSLQTVLGWESALHVALAGVGMFIFLRRLKRGVSASLLGALFFSLSGSEISQIYSGAINFIEAIALVPWVFWAAQRANEEESWFSWGLCGLACALQILAGGTQLFVYTFSAAAMFILAQNFMAKKKEIPSGDSQRGPASYYRSIPGFVLALGLASILSAPQLWPTLQYLPFTSRQSWTYSQFVGGSIALPDTLSWLVPGFFGWMLPSYHGSLSTCTTHEYFGLLPWGLAAAGLAACWKKESTVRILVAVGLIALFFAQKSWIPFYQIFHHLPFFKGFRDWARILFLVTFSVCALAAYGWDALGQVDTKKKALRGASVYIIFAFLFAGLAWFLAVPSALEGAPGLKARYLSTDYPTANTLLMIARNSVLTTLTLLPALCVVFWTRFKSRGAWSAVLLALAFHAIDQNSVIGRCVTFMDSRNAVSHPNSSLPPPAPPGVEPWRISESDISFPNDALMFGYENIDGVESMPLDSRQKMVDALDKNPTTWFNLMDERYLFSHSKTTANAPGDLVTIYENRSAFPRAWLVGRSVLVGGDAEAYRKLGEAGFDPRTEVAVTSTAGLDGRPASGAIQWLRRSPQTFSLSVSTDRAAALVISDFWYPSWVARIDGIDSLPLKADGGLQTVFLDKGSHRVDFRFDPGLFYDALAACFTGMLFLAGLAWLERKVPFPTQLKD